MQAMNEAYESGLDFTDTDKIISQRLTIFHNIIELQQQNQKQQQHHHEVQHEYKLLIVHCAIAYLS